MAALRPGQAELHPAREAGDLCRRQGRARGHLQIALVADGPEEEAVARLAGHGGRAVLAPLEESGAGGEAAPAAGLAVGVTGEAAGHQQGADFLLEEVLRGAGASLGLGREAAQSCEEEKEQGRPVGMGASKRLEGGRYGGPAPIQATA